MTIITGNDNNVLQQILSIVKEMQTTMGTPTSGLTFAQQLQQLQNLVGTVNTNVSNFGSAIATENADIAQALAALQATNPDPDGVVAQAIATLTTASANIANASAAIQTETQTVAAALPPPAPASSAAPAAAVKTVPAAPAKS
jgi:hypothetical protein